MTKEFEGYISELPKGCITETDIYTDKGVLLCPKMTVMDENTLEKLSNYKGPVQYQTILESNSQLLCGR